MVCYIVMLPAEIVQKIKEYMPRDKHLAREVPTELYRWMVGDLSILQEEFRAWYEEYPDNPLPFHLWFIKYTACNTRNYRMMMEKHRRRIKM